MRIGQHVRLSTPFDGPFQNQQNLRSAILAGFTVIADKPGVLADRRKCVRSPLRHSAKVHVRVGAAKKVRISIGVHNFSSSRCGERGGCPNRTGGNNYSRPPTARRPSYASD
jgi:hypothetical protein